MALPVGFYGSLQWIGWLSLLDEVALNHWNTQMYHNEDALGNAIQENLIDRNDIFLISKVDNSNQGYKNTITRFYDSLSKLKTDYLDAFLIH